MWAPAGFAPFRIPFCPPACLCLCPAEMSVLSELKSNSYFEGVTWDVALEAQDPYAVGVAIKSANAPFNSPRAGPAAAGADADEGSSRLPSKRELRDAAKKSRDSTKGFSDGKSG